VRTIFKALAANQGDAFYSKCDDSTIILEVKKIGALYTFPEEVQNDKTVVCLTNKRISHNLKEKKEEKSLRDKLSTKIKNLKHNNSELLYAELITKRESFFDVENALFYDIGTGIFKGICENGLVFIYPSEKNENEAFQNKYSYRMTEKKDSNFKIDEMFKSGRKIFEICFYPESLNTNSKFYNYWLLIKRGNPKVNENKNSAKNKKSYIGIDVGIGYGFKIINFSSVMKALIDGIFVSMHHTDCINPEALKVFEKKISIPENKLKDLLKDKTHSVLGERKGLISKCICRGGKISIKCNSKDELCRFFRIMKNDSYDKNDKSVSVAVYEFDRIESLF